MPVGPCRAAGVALLATLVCTLPAMAVASPLEDLLRAFAHRKDVEAMQALPGIAWKGVSYPTDSEKDNSYTYLLRGGLRLSGFGEVDVPVGVGANQTTRKANEGDASFEIRFSTANNPALRGPVQIVMVKPYPSTDYGAVLRRNLPGDKLVLLADGCTRDTLGRPAEDAHAIFYRIDLPSTPSPVFVLASRNADGGNSGPGDTTFAFSLFTPGTDMEASGCTLHDPK